MKKLDVIIVIVIVDDSAVDDVAVTDRRLFQQLRQPADAGRWQRR